MKRYALAGNPNCGKTTLFNILTGSTAHVGNWPGVTVDKREGVYKKGAEPISIIDLPGIYSLSPYTPEEVVSRNYILDEKPDCVINIVDATNLERNLYLSTQILEIDVPVVIALNMTDMLEKRGDKIDEKALEKRIGVPVVKICALKGSGLEELMKRAEEVSSTYRNGVSVLFGAEISHLVNDVKIALKGQDVDNPLFHAVKLIENDELEVQMHPQTIKMVEEFKTTFDDDVFGTDIEALIADARYKHISAHYSPTLVRKDAGITNTTSDKADKILTNKWASIPIFLFILFAMFHLTFSENFLMIGSIFSLPTIDELGLANNFGTELLSCFYDGAIFSPGVILFNLMELIVSYISGWIVLLIKTLGASPAIIAVVEQGVLGGIGAVLSFVPQILLLLLLISILEDSGYMARVAFIFDKIFRKFGVSGRALIPMIMGFGCSVPAMINTRTLADEREKILTLRVIPFFTCGAKVPILVAVAGAIINAMGIGNADIITYAMYLLGMVVAVVSILIMRSTTQHGEIPPFIMELPTYHLPSFRSLMLHMWDKAKHFLHKAFTIIFISTLVVFLLSNFSWDWKFLMQEVDGAMVNLRMNESILGSIGMFIQPIFTPLGFGSQLGKYGWMLAVAALTGLIAKENVVSTLGTLAACLGLGVIASEDGVLEVGTILRAIASDLGVSTSSLVPAMISFIAFNMTTIPCFASVATAKGELKKGTLINTILFWVATSFIVSAVVYLVLSWWWTAFIVLAVLIIAVCVIRIYNKKRFIAKKEK